MSPPGNQEKLAHASARLHAGVVAVRRCLPGQSGQADDSPLRRRHRPLSASPTVQLAGTQLLLSAPGRLLIQVARPSNFGAASLATLEGVNVTDDAAGADWAPAAACTLRATAIWAIELAPAEAGAGGVDRVGGVHATLALLADPANRLCALLDRYGPAGPGR